MLAVLITIAFLHDPATAQTFGERSGEASTIRLRYGIDERVALIKALILGPAEASLNELNVLSVDHEIVLSLVESVTFDGVDRHVAWKDVAATELLRQLNALDPRDAEPFFDHLLETDFPRTVMSEYIHNGQPGALAWYVKLLREAIARADAQYGGRQGQIFGSMYSTLEGAWAEEVWNADRKTPAMNMILAMISVALTKGLDGDLQPSHRYSMTSNWIVDSRLKQLTPLLRHVRDTPDFDYLNTEPASINKLWLETKTLLDDYFVLIEHRNYLRALGPPHDGLRTTTDQLRFVIGKIHLAVRNSIYVAHLNHRCGELLGI